MKLHKLHKKEIPMVQQLAREIWEEHYIKILSQEQIDYMLDLFYSEEKIKIEIDEGVSWEILWKDKRPIGYLVCKIEPEKLYISKIYLKAETRGKGFGKFLMKHAIELATQSQKKSVYLNVNKNNIESIEFYKSNGFDIVAEGVFDIGKGYVMDDFIMELTIN